MLPLKLLPFGFGGDEPSSCALWSSSRRACAVATRSKNSSFCSEVMEENWTVENEEKKSFDGQMAGELKYSRRSKTDVGNVAWHHLQNILESLRGTAGFLVVSA